MLALLPILAGIVPGIINLIRGNAKGGIVDDVLNIVKAVTGSTDPNVVQEKLQDDQIKAQLQVQLATLAFQATQAQLAADQAKRTADLQEFQAELGDAQSARSSMVTLAQAGSKIAWGAPIVSVINTIGFFVILVLLLFHNSITNDAGVLDLLKILLGVLGAGFTQVGNYWLGSSQGSRNKDQSFSALTAHLVAQKQDAITKPVLAPLAAPIDNFKPCLNFVILQEGGYADNPSDKGGPTKYGITAETLAHFRGVAAVLPSDVENLDLGEATEIYRSNYWLPLNCEKLPKGVDLCVFDFGVNAGPKNSVKLLQKLVGVLVDGSIGPKTIAAAKAMSDHELIAHFTAARIAYYKQLKEYPTFGKGWLARAQDCSAAAMSMT